MGELEVPHLASALAAVAAVIACETKAGRGERTGGGERFTGERKHKTPRWNDTRIETSDKQLGVLSKMPACGRA